MPDGAFRIIAYVGLLILAVAAGSVLARCAWRARRARHPAGSGSGLTPQGYAVEPRPGAQAPMSPWSTGPHQPAAGPAVSGRAAGPPSVHAEAQFAAQPGYAGSPLDRTSSTPQPITPRPIAPPPVAPEPVVGLRPLYPQPMYPQTVPQAAHPQPLYPPPAGPAPANREVTRQEATDRVAAHPELAYRAAHRQPAAWQPGAETWPQPGEPATHGRHRAPEHPPPPDWPPHRR